jgi:hypothetical protein
MVNRMLDLYRSDPFARLSLPLSLESCPRSLEPYQRVSRLARRYLVDVQGNPAPLGGRSQRIDLGLIQGGLDPADFSLGELHDRVNRRLPLAEPETAVAGLLVNDR